MKQYTAKQRATIAEAFRRAKPYLWAGAQPNTGRLTEYICVAIHQANSAPSTHLSGILVTRAGLMACDIIRDRMNGQNNLRSWLFYEAQIPLEKLTDKAMQAYRHRWLDSLIAEFSTTEQS